jgi:hypothetical protein
MSIYLNTVTGEYPRHDGDLELLGWQLGEPLPENWVSVLETEELVPGTNEVVESQPPVFIDGQWHMSWEIRTMTPEEIIRVEEFNNQSIGG